jgi:glycosyltransferase involved in cell wall biosynthesis
MLEPPIQVRTMQLQSVIKTVSLRSDCLDSEMAAPTRELAAAKEVPHHKLPIPTVSIVIPTLNEAENLPALLPQIPDWVHEIIIVDGRSTDDTVNVARRLCPSVKIVLEPRRGKGVALRSGFSAATGEIIVMMDADGSMRPEEIVHFVGALMAGADFVKGSRFLQGAGTDDMSYMRMFGNWGLTRFVRLLFGGHFSDLCYGYMGFWSKHVPVLHTQADGFEIETALSIRACKAKLRIVEVASFEKPRLFGESHLNTIRDGWRVFTTIISERLNLGWSFSLNR